MTKWAGQLWLSGGSYDYVGGAVMTKWVGQLWLSGGQLWLSRWGSYD